MDSPRISFVIPCKNGALSLGACLESILALRQEDDEIIVVDNGSTDGSVDIARQFHGVTIIFSSATTISGVRNAGARSADGEWLAFVDCDVVLGSGWRHSLQRVFRDPSIVGTGSGPHLPMNPTWVERAWLCGWGTGPGPVEYVWSGNLIVRREAYWSIQGFDESLETDEDTDLCWRLRNAFGDGSLVSAAEMEAVHLGNSKTVRQYWRRQYWHAAGLLSSARKHGLDKAMIMTLAFMSLHIIGFAALLRNPKLYGLGVLFCCILLIPMITALYRTRSLDCVRWVPQLLLLYTLFYYARVLRIAQTLLRGEAR